MSSPVCRTRSVQTGPELLQSMYERKGSKSVFSSLINLNEKIAKFTGIHLTNDNNPCKKKHSLDSDDSCLRTISNNCYNEKRYYFDELPVERDCLEELNTLKLLRESSR